MNLAPIIPLRVQAIAALLLVAFLPPSNGWCQQKPTVIPGKVELTDKIRGDMMSLIRARGYTCPAVVGVYDYGTEVYCAREPFKASDPLWKYRVTKKARGFEVRPEP